MPTRQEPPLHHRKPRRRLPAGARLALLIVGSLAAIVVMAAIALRIAFPPARVRALVQQQLSTALARQVRFGDARLGLWPPVRLTVADPAISDPGGFQNGVLFRAHSVHLDLDVGAMFTRRLVVRRLLLDQPDLHVVLRSDGSTNLDSLGTGAAG